MNAPRSRRSQHDVIKLDPEGNWYQGEYPILHERTIQFLYKNIAVDQDGSYFLTGEDKPIFISVDEVAYWIVKIERTIAGFLITLTDDSVELLNLHSLWAGKKNALYCLVKGGRLPAKFFRGPYYEITKDLQQKGKKFFLVFGGKKYPIQNTPPKQIASLGKKIPVKVRKKHKHKKAAKKKR
ncbi:MAG: DUF1285 domain-containing protein [Deltaproteobacteria bacterium]|nr:DUF1285 domain-containing protein [Deltaproteobacteria bacterium]